jgi:RHH-type transcriptional regulator, rel operon repressor / antitoxin RelB
MSAVTISLQIPQELWRRLEKASEYGAISTDDTVVSALEQYLEYEDETRAAVEEGIRQADAGELIDHEEVVKWFEAKKQRINEAA